MLYYISKATTISPMQKLACLETLIPWCPLPSPKLSCDTVWVVPLDNIEAYQWASRPPNLPVTRAHLVQPEIILGIISHPIDLQHKMILVKYTVPSQLMCSYVSYHYLLMSQHIQLVDVAFVSRNRAACVHIRHLPTVGDGRKPPRIFSIPPVMWEPSFRRYLVFLGASNGHPLPHPNLKAPNKATHTRCALLPTTCLVELQIQKLLIRGPRNCKCKQIDNLVTNYLTI